LRLQADPEVLRQRYARELAELDREVERLEKKLANERFVANAKPDVVAGERAKLETYRRRREAVAAADSSVGR
jgi:valyl-tRNA synthetase